MTHQHQPTAADFFAQPAEDDETEGPFAGLYADAQQAVADLDLRLKGLEQQLAGITAQRPITVYEGVSAAATAEEIARLMAAQGGDYASAETGEEMHPKYLYDDLVAKYDTVLNVLHDVEAALGKSKAAPALAAKAVIEEWRNPEVPAPEPHVGPEVQRCSSCDGAGCDACKGVGEWVGTDYEVYGDDGPRQSDLPSLADMDEANEPVQPAHDAPVEEWREYARKRGMAGPHIDKANRSQIRTALGIAHTPAGA